MSCDTNSTATLKNLTTSMPPLTKPPLSPPSPTQRSRSMKKSSPPLPPHHSRSNQNRARTRTLSPVPTHRRNTFQLVNLSGPPPRRRSNSWAAPQASSSAPKSLMASTSPITSPRSRSSSSCSDTSQSSTETCLMDLEDQLATALKTKGAYHSDVALLYNCIGNLHFRNAHFRYAKEYYELASRCEFGAQAATGYMNLATVYWRQGDVDDALVLLQEVLTRHETDLLSAGREDLLSVSPIIASVFHQLGLCHALKQDFSKAMNSMQQALNIRKNLHATVDEGKTLDAMGRIAYLQGDFDTAFEYHETAFQLLSSIRADTDRTLQHLADVHEAAGNFPKAVSVWKDIAASRAAGSFHSRREALLNMARIYQKSGLLDDAETCLREAERLSL